MGNDSNLPSESCFNYFGRKIPIAKIDSYIETGVECSKPGIIFVTKKGYRTCVDPQLSWVGNALKVIDDRDM
ncbi:C-C motif chemokine 8-like protein [Labeo rohita]|uniref:C-C motif chemokine 8-like protein n=1 Tax=Labeo rohita TaxID=84645 RepID=A0A498MDE9_LABRO|nr:C-C motif chemokine 8-like protein [Labeo rohita]